MDPDPYCLSIPVLTVSGFFSLKIIVLLLLLSGSALISGAEVALFGLSQTDLDEMEEEHGQGTSLLRKLLDNPKKLLATILITNNAINIGIVLLFSSIGNTLFSDMDKTLFGIISVRFLLEVIVATFLILMFGEILPKIYANRNKRRFSSFMTRPLNVLRIVLNPFSTPMSSATIFLQERLGRQKSNFGVDHLSQALELASEGDTTKEEKKILEGIVTFGNTDTKQVMRPRIDIFALNEEIEVT